MKKFPDNCPNCHKPTHNNTVLFVTDFNYRCADCLVVIYEKEQVTEKFDGTVTI